MYCYYTYPCKVLSAKLPPEQLVSEFFSLTSVQFSSSLSVMSNFQNHFNMGNDLDGTYNSILPSIRNFVARFGYTIVQEFGQRRLLPQRVFDEFGSNPPDRTDELFVSNIPKNCFENELFVFFNRAGLIWKLRLMINFSGSTRGYCYVSYTHEHELQRALNDLSYAEIRPGVKLFLQRSRNNRRLKVIINSDYRRRHFIEQVLYHLTPGIEHCEFSQVGAAIHVVISYAEHRFAAKALGLLTKGLDEVLGVATRAFWNQLSDHEARNQLAAGPLERNGQNHRVGWNPNRGFGPRH